MHASLFIEIAKHKRKFPDSYPASELLKDPRYPIPDYVLELERKTPHAQFEIKQREFEQAPIKTKPPINNIKIGPAQPYKRMAATNTNTSKINEEKRLLKQQFIQNSKAFCPGCLRSFEGTPTYGLHIIFQLCHYHGRNCKIRRHGTLEEAEKIFIACQECNRQQRDICGYYENGQFFPLQCS